MKDLNSENSHLRDWYAGLALQAMLTNGFQPNFARENYTNTADFNYVRAAWLISDKMMRWRKNEMKDEDRPVIPANPEKV